MAARPFLDAASDERLAEEMSRGNEAAFEVAYERHAHSLRTICRRMLGSSEDAEEALQQAMASVWWYLQREDQLAPEHLRAWLFAVVRNHCLTVLRSRGERRLELDGPASAPALAEQAEQRAEVRALLADLSDLPDDQRQALLLSELAGLSHAHIARVLDRREPRIKSLIFQARATLADWRAARDASCSEIREQLVTAHGGSLRRRDLRRHLQLCESCRTYRVELRARRRGLAILFPLVPSLLWQRAAAVLTGVARTAASGGPAAEVTFGPPAATMAVVCVMAAGGLGGTGGLPAALLGHGPRLSHGPPRSLLAAGDAGVVAHQPPMLTSVTATTSSPPASTPSAVPPNSNQEPKSQPAPPPPPPKSDQQPKSKPAPPPPPPKSAGQPKSKPAPPPPPPKSAGQPKSKPAPPPPH